MLRGLKKGLNRDYPGEAPSLLQSRMHEFRKETERTFRMQKMSGHEKVEEAVSIEQFGQRNSRFSSQDISGRDPDIIAKAIASRVRKGHYKYPYQKMWEWLEAGNTPADFIREKGELLKSFQISTNYAYKMFNKIKKWQSKGVPPIHAESDHAPKKSS